MRVWRSGIIIGLLKYSYFFRNSIVFSAIGKSFEQITTTMMKWNWLFLKKKWMCHHIRSQSTKFLCWGWWKIVFKICQRWSWEGLWMQFSPVLKTHNHLDKKTSVERRSQYWKWQWQLGRLCWCRKGFPSLCIQPVIDSLMPELYLFALLILVEMKYEIIF